jgi:dephospho-CoA kinase
VSRWPNKYVIGLTGNIAVGKSVVRQMLQHLGAYTIDADGLAHQAMSPGAPAYKPVLETFGQVILNPDQTINRSMLGSMVFSNPALLQKLESITHPIIGQAINTLVSRAKQKVVVIEAIKLLEGDLGKAVDEVWTVNASPKTQYTRLISKRKMSEEAAKQRILAQNTQKDKVKAANVVINNDSDVEQTWKQVQAAWQKVADKLKPKPADPAKAEPAPAQASPEPEPTAATPTETTNTADAPTVDTSGITVRRAMPTHAETIADFINKETERQVDRMDVIMSFGQKSYLIAEVEEDSVGIIGWQVENLITRVDELYLEDSLDAPEKVIYAMIRAVEDASRELQSEVSFVFLPEKIAKGRDALFTDNGYEQTAINDIKVPAWREAVQEVYQDGMTIFTKRLRKDRVLKPI